MSRKSKGINAERDLIHMFWAKKDWSAIRVAGSGSMKYPSPDILAANKSRRIALECKTSKDSNKYFTDEDINQLKEFCNLFGAEPWIAVKFDRNDWFFINPEDLPKSGKHFVINLENAKRKGLLFEEFIGNFNEN